MIYFIESESGHIKIGCTQDIDVRLATLQGASPFVLTLLNAISGDYEQEKLIHQKFEKHRIRGEWFSRVQEIIEFANNPDGTRYDAGCSGENQTKFQNAVKANRKALLAANYTPACLTMWAYGKRHPRYETAVKLVPLIGLHLHEIPWIRLQIND